MPGVEVLITGEVSEWEVVEYVRDAALQGRHTALILLGHNASEELSMEPFAARIQLLYPQVPVKFIPAGEPYWTLDRPVPTH
jgi:putative NIF3 family GTP cyclohydrolase 1 type 2